MYRKPQTADDIANTPQEHDKVEDNQNKEGDSLHVTTKKNNVICHFYRKGICKYGKKGDGCKFEHPSYCRKLLDYSRRG